MEEEKKQDIEDIDESSSITTPFDPNKIKVRTQPHTLGQIIDRLEHGEINMNTDFQRLPNLWNDVKKSRLIESIILNLPIPTFYFDGQNDDHWGVIDGLQRISTIKAFCVDKDNPLVLSGLEFLTELEGKTFNELPRNIQRRIKTFPITVYILEQGTPVEVKYNIFSRVNQGGLELKPQEIRHALHQGGGAELVMELVAKDGESGKAFIKATEAKVKAERMQDRDFATRFLSFYVLGYENYEPDLDTFMNKGMSAVKNLSIKEKEDVKNAFTKAMETAYFIFEKDAFRKRFQQDDPRKPVNKALFEILSVLLAKLADNDRSLLIAKKELFKNKLIELHQDQKFIAAISQGTAEKEKVYYRFECIGKIIKETLES